MGGKVWPKVQARALLVLVLVLVASAASAEATLDGLSVTAAGEREEPDPNQPGPDGALPLFRAARLGDLELFRKLLERGASPGQVGPFGETALDAAVAGEHAEIVSLLQTAGAPRSDGESLIVAVLRGEGNLKALIDGEPEGAAAQAALVLAVREGLSGMVDRLLAAGTPPEGGAGGDSALRLAARLGQTAIVRQLLDAGASTGVNKPQIWELTEWSPLMEAVQGGYIEIVELLLAKDASVSPPSTDLVSAFLGGRAFGPVWLAASQGRADLVRLLLAHGAKVDEDLPSEGTPLAVAVRKGYAAVVAELLRYKPDLSQVSLPTAVAGGFQETVELLLGAGVRPDSEAVRTALETRDLGIARLILQGIESFDMPVSYLDEPVLYCAVSQGDAALVRLVLELAAARGGLKVNWIDSSGQSALHKAVRLESPEIVRLLLQAGADPYLTDQYNQAPIVQGFLYGGELAVAFLTGPLRLDAALSQGRTLLTLAMEGGEAAVVEELLRRGADINRADESGSTPLLIAAAGSPTLVARLLAAGADPNRINERGETPLLVAARSGDEKTCDLLLASKASPTARNERGQTVLIAAAGSGKLGLLRKLLALGADPSDADEEGVTALFSVVMNCDRSLETAADWGGVARALLQAGADPGKPQGFGVPPLLMAAANACLPVVDALLEAKADPKAMDPNGGTALHWLFLTPFRSDGSEQATIVTRLVKAGVDPSARMIDGTTPLMAAAEAGELAGVEALLAAGAAVDLRNDQGSTALSLASVKGHSAVIQRLVQAGASVE